MTGWRNGTQAKAISSPLEQVLRDVGDEIDRDEHGDRDAECDRRRDQAEPAIWRSDHSSGIPALRRP